MRIFLIIITIIGFSSPSWAADSDAPAAAATPAAGKVINDDDAPAAPAKASLSDLRDQQIQNENEDAQVRENTANADANTDPDACTARDISETMRMPEGIRNDSPQPNNNNAKNQKEPSKSAICHAAYDKMTNACYKDMPCSGCEDAVKQFSDACGYVKREEIPGAMGGGGIGRGGGRTLDGRSNVPVNKLPQQ